jgi:plastocyanin
MNDDPTAGGAGEQQAAPGAVVTLEEPAPPAIAEAGPDPVRAARRDRLWLPLVIPVGAILAVLFVVLNVSRVFLAVSEVDKAIAVGIGTALTVLILAGAAALSASRRVRATQVTLGLGVSLLLLALFGSMMIGAASPKEEVAAGWQEPAGEPINTLEVDALPTLKFQADEFTAPAGINLVRYVNKGGVHTLLIGAPWARGFKLQVPPAVDEAKIEMEPGTYQMWCDVPGHREAGMEATLVVTEGPPPAEGGEQAPGGTPTTTGPAA